MIVLNNKLERSIPELMVLVGEYINTGKKLPDEFNPVHIISVDIDSLPVEKKIELVSRIENSIDNLKRVLGKGSDLFKVAS